MIISALMRGIVVGLIVSVPLGPIGFLTIDHTISYGIRTGLISALVMASIDIIATACTLFGLHYAVTSIHTIPFFIKLVGSVIIFFVGLRSAMKKESQSKLTSKRRTLLKILLVIISNPATYLSFGIISILFAPLLANGSAARLAAFVGFVIASLGWWLMLVFAAEGIKRHLSKYATLERLIGICIMICALGIMIPSYWYHDIRHFIP